MNLKARPPRKDRIHRSFLLDAALVDEARKLVAPELSGNLNRIVNMALAALIEKQQKLKFADEMAVMAQDLALRKESIRISHEFRSAEKDGL